MPSDTTAGTQARAGAGWEDAGLWASFARWAPVAIAGYVLALLLLRLSLSAFLEVDEAEFVGLVGLQLVYENSHPPFFNWLARLALELTGWSWPLALGLVKYGLLGAFHFFTFDAARRLGGDRAGVAALAASAFLPQIVWMSAHTLAHSIAVVAMAAGAVWAAVRVREAHRAGDAASAWRWAALAGVFAAAGALSKFNFALFLGPFVLALALDPAWRAAFGGGRAVLAGGVFAVLATPSYVAAVLDLSTSAARIEKLYRPEGGVLGAIDPPLLGVDGLLTLGVAALAWAGPLVVAWAVLSRAVGSAAPAEGPPAEGPPAEAARTLARAMAFGLALFAAIVLLADMHKVEERYLTPILAALPIALAVGRPLSGPAVAILTATAAALYLAVLPGVAGMAAFGKHRFGYPYEALAARIAQLHPEPPPLLASRHDDRANLILALGWTGAAEPSYAEPTGRALLVWRGGGPVAPDRTIALAPPGFAPAGPAEELRAPFTNYHDETLVYGVQLFVRTE